MCLFPELVLKLMDPNILEKYRGKKILEKKILYFFFYIFLPLQLNTINQVSFLCYVEFYCVCDVDWDELRQRP